MRLLSAAILALALGNQAIACTPGSYQCSRCAWQDDDNYYCSDLQVCNVDSNWQTLYDCRSIGFNIWCRQSGNSFWCG